eukprot:2654612-Amphidinium_carterae.1
MAPSPTDLSSEIFHCSPPRALPFLMQDKTSEPARSSLSATDCEVPDFGGASDPLKEFARRFLCLSLVALRRTASRRSFWLAWEATKAPAAEGQ